MDWIVFSWDTSFEQFESNPNPLHTCSLHPCKGILANKRNDLIHFNRKVQFSLKGINLLTNLILIERKTSLGSETISRPQTAWKKSLRFTCLQDGVPNLQSPRMSI